LENKRLLSISVLILAASIVFGSIFIGRSIERIGKTQVCTTQVSKEKGLWTEKEASEYLNISIEEFNKILSKDTEEKRLLTSFPTYKYIPYAEIGNGKKMFSKKELDEWIKFNMLNK